MRWISGAALGALILAAGVAPAEAADFFGPADEGPPPVVTRRTIVERPVVLPPRRIVREVIVERPVVYRPPPVIREVIVDTPIVYPPGPYLPAEVQARIGLYETRFGPRPIPYGGLDPLD
ncbi:MULTISPECIES: hypothetical protein [Methylobacterium]|uniref:hypothetical protein n=1 Tax=Methylobacterium TaxID=407 RepID=UPI001046F7B6|nr:MULTISPECIES: hypothetical protein [Methylobacterium]MDR7039266.1 hypothetical protein [Methylobacterium sp. BE186]